MTRIGRNHQYRKARAQVLAGAQLCGICGDPLDFDAPARSRWAPSADHLLPVSSLAGMDPRDAASLAADPSLLRPAHYGCNASRGDGRRSRPVGVSRDWAS